MADPAALRLTKHHGAGNDFLVLLDPDDRRPLSAAEAAALCARRTGLGADGMLRATSGADGADLTMELRNADGGLAEMSGNGIRCLVQAAVDGGLAGAGAVRVATAAGLRTVTYRPGSTPGLGHASVAMGPPLVGEDLDPGDLATAVAAATGTDVGEESRWLATALAGVRHICRVDMGNPHLVLFGDADLAGRTARLGSVLCAATDGGTNVEVVWPGDGPGELRMRVWERGVGETLACGTGTCAVAAAARRWGEAGERVAVHNPGGTLEVILDRDGATLAGPTQTVGAVTVAEEVLAALVAASPAPTDAAAEPAR